MMDLIKSIKAVIFVYFTRYPVCIVKRRGRPAEGTVGNGETVLRGKLVHALKRRDCEKSAQIP